MADKNLYTISRYATQHTRDGVLYGITVAGYRKVPNEDKREYVNLWVDPAGGQDAVIVKNHDGTYTLKVRLVGVNEKTHEAKAETTQSPKKKESGNTGTVSPL